MGVYLWVYICVGVYLWLQGEAGGVQLMCAVGVYLYVCSCVCVCLYAYMSVCEYMCEYVCVRIRV